MKVLVINCGSSSIKFQLFDSESESVLAKGLCERIGIDGSSITYTFGEKEEITKKVPMSDHSLAMTAVIEVLTDPLNGVISDMSSVDAVGHRVVHGGEYFNESVLITEDVIKKIESCNYLAPLHNPANLTGIRVCLSLMKDTPNVAVFDTAFHQTMPKSAYLYAIPRKYYDDYKIRRYGFHGTSHSYVSRRVADIMGKSYDDLKIIVCHLGNGASICAIDRGKSVDTSMGLTPLSGVIMGTRSGDIDPGIIEVIAQEEGMNISQITDMLNKESGIAGLSEVSSDFRDISKAIEDGNENARDAFDAYVHQIVRFVGSYIAVMDGADALVFTAGVGENNAMVREQVCAQFSYMGLELDKEKNEDEKGERVISTPNSRLKAYVIPTNEELAIERETVEVINKSKMIHNFLRKKVVDKECVPIYN